MQRHYPPLPDVALALVVAGLVQLELWGSDVTTPVAIALPATLVMTLPLAWRRVAPLAVAGVVAGAWAAQALLDDSEQQVQSTLLALALAVYSVGAYAGRNRAIAGLGLVVAAVAVGEAGDLIVLGPFFVGVWLAGRLFRDRQHLAVELLSQTEALERERQETARLAVADERARIARELHDVVAHSLSVIVVQAGAERLALRDGSESTAAVLRAIEETGREALTEMRRMLGMLREDETASGTAPQPGLDRLEELVGVVRDAGLPVELRVEGRPRPLPPGLDISAYRILQEGLTNVLRHAHATRARILVRFGAGELELEVEDDGTGARDAAAVPGHGLLGMRERVALYGGVLDAGAGDGGGFLVRARLPIGQTAP